MQKPHELIAYAQAYAHGVLDGYNTGSEDNIYEDSSLRSAYSHGYEYGLFLYSEELNEENLNIELDDISHINE